MLKESCAERPVLTQKEREVLNFIRDYWKKYQLYGRVSLSKWLEHRWKKGINAS